tara:strand:+ start:276 stop:644 length:369 start_codon:yes stop_codon:yes gene_type:complete
MAKNDHLNYLELIYYGKDCQDGIRYSKYNKHSEKNADREIRICTKCDKVYEIYNVGQKKYVQFNYKDFPRIGKRKEKCAMCRRKNGETAFFTWDRGSRTSIPISRFSLGYKKKIIRNEKKTK